MGWDGYFHSLCICLHIHQCTYKSVFLIFNIECDSICHSLSLTCVSCILLTNVLLPFCLGTTVILAQQPTIIWAVGMFVFGSFLVFINQLNAFLLRI